MSKSASDQTVVPEGFGTETSSSTVRGCAALGFGADGGASIITRFERVPMAGLSAGVFAGARALLAGDAMCIVKSEARGGGMADAAGASFLWGGAHGARRAWCVERGARPREALGRERPKDENDLF